ncbi:hypothetical protein LWI29_027307 [Acer saccharum]|uniref:DUF4218 domain-containing protein n=1 Tax=Acer saccharum TaxID=4024 RepID=A0AA39RF61_ACESA|nr:hypothetical protein LWI29_027307 [Acer saccharum]
MVHLAIHLPIEAKLAGPVAYHWMYPFERYLGTLKKYVRNKAKPEGSIAEAYVVNKALTFCSMYLGGIEIKFNRPERNDDKGKNRQECVLSHKKELESESPTNIFERQEQQFPEWFKKHMITLHHKGLVEATDELYSLSCGPDLRVNSYNSCIINGVRFHTKAHDERHTTQNSGVVVPREHDDNVVDFYGVVIAVLQLNYILGYKVLLFKCQWFDTDVKKRRIHKDYHLTSINVSREWYKSDPFVLAMQAQQVFYVDDYKFGTNWKVVQYIQRRHLWDIPEMNDTKNSQDTNDVYQENKSFDIQLMVQEDDLEIGQFHRVDVSAKEVSANVILDIEKQTTNDDIFEFEDEDETIMDYCSDNEESLLNKDDIDDDE